MWQRYCAAAIFVRVNHLVGVDTLWVLIASSITIIWHVINAFPGMVISYPTLTLAVLRNDERE